MVDLRSHGLSPVGSVYARLAPAEYLEHALARHEGLLADSGALVAYTGAQTGRSPRDKYFVTEPAVKNKINWGKVNLPLEPAAFDKLLGKVGDYLSARDLFVFD